MNKNNLRTFKPNTIQYELYKKAHINQTYDFVIKMNEKYSNLNNDKLYINDVLKMMDDFIDPSDPDLDIPNSIHAYQTAERIRKKYPNNYELQITGLIHDLGKILFKFNEPNWAIVGDTFVVGCEFPKSIVYWDTLKDNKDFNNPKFYKNGIYKEKCGIENLTISFGHDEYLYKVLTQNKNHKLSKDYLDIIRFHSFYPWHSSNEYHQFMCESDNTILKNVLNFNKFDLYSKEDDTIITEDIKDYYDKLLKDYFPDKLQW
jgi:inositol oxygenase